MTATAYSVLTLDVSDGVAEITLNRPDAANALNADLFRELNDAVLRCDADPAVRAVIVTGTAVVAVCHAGTSSIATPLVNIARPAA